MVRIFRTRYNDRYITDIGAWKYVEQHRHAYFDQMQVTYFLFYKFKV